MFSFSKTSLERLETCDERIQAVMHEVIKQVDITVLWGHRGEVEQNRFFRKKRSKLEFPNSKHNSWPSQAIDIAPWPIDWEDREGFYYMAGIVMATAEMLESPLRWGGDWDRDRTFEDNKFDDLAHFELWERRNNRKE